MHWSLLSFCDPVCHGSWKFKEKPDFQPFPSYFFDGAHSVSSTYATDWVHRLLVLCSSNGKTLKWFYSANKFHDSESNARMFFALEIIRDGIRISVSYFIVLFVEFVRPPWKWIRSHSNPTVYSYRKQGSGKNSIKLEDQVQHCAWSGSGRGVLTLPGVYILPWEHQIVKHPPHTILRSPGLRFWPSPPCRSIHHTKPSGRLPCPWGHWPTEGLPEGRCLQLWGASPGAPNWEGPNPHPYQRGRCWPSQVGPVNSPRGVELRGIRPRAPARP